jgi:hypothetical protein
MLKLTLTVIVACDTGEECSLGKQVVLPICPRIGDYVMVTDQVAAMCSAVMLQEDYFPIVNLIFIEDDEEESMKFFTPDEYLEVRDYLGENGWAILDEEIIEIAKRLH